MLVPSPVAPTQSHRVVLSRHGRLRKVERWQPEILEATWSPIIHGDSKSRMYTGVTSLSDEYAPLWIWVSNALTAWNCLTLSAFL